MDWLFGCKVVFGRARINVGIGHFLGKYPTEALSKGMYGIHTITNTWLGTNSILVPGTSTCSVRRQYRHPTLGKGIPGVFTAPKGSVPSQYATGHSSMDRYELDIGTRQFGNSGTASIPVFGSSVNYVRLKPRSRHFDTFRYAH